MKIIPVFENDNKASFYMGGFKELNPKVVVVDKNNRHRYTSSTNPGVDKYMGNTEPVTFRQQMDLIRLDDFDKNWLESKKLKLKDNEIVCRYRTSTTVAGGITPLVKINVSKMLVYFNVGEDDGEDVVFDTKGTKLLYLNLITED